MLPPSFVLVAVCLHGAHILSGELLSSLVWHDLFSLQARLQLSNTYQNIYSLPVCLYAPSTNLHLISYPSTSVLSTSLSDLQSHAKPPNFLHPCYMVLNCIPSLLLYSLCSFSLLIMQVNAEGALFAVRAMWEHQDKSGISGSE